MMLHWAKPGEPGDRLILVFNGFAMDENPWRLWSQPLNSTLAFVRGYHELEVPLPPTELARIRSFSRVDVVAWSLGVWVYGTVADTWALPPGKRLAVNGTLTPLHPDWGIPPAIFALTRRTFSEATRETFYRRVCGSEEVWKLFQPLVPQRSADEQAQELAVFYEALQASAHLTTRPETAQLFSTILISSHDQIMPPAAQRRFWQRGHELAAGHYPFHLWPSWEAFLSLPAEDVHAV